MRITHTLSLSTAALVLSALAARADDAAIVQTAEEAAKFSLGHTLILLMAGFLGVILFLGRPVRRPIIGD